MKKRSAVALLLVGATVLGATVFREPIANAAQLVSAEIVGPLDAEGNVRVHEQGTANARVNNPPDQPVPVRDVENPPSTPFQQTLELESTSDLGAEDCASFAVPLRKHLAIEHIAVALSMSGRNDIPKLSDERWTAASLVKLVTVKTRVGDDIAVYPVPLGQELQEATVAEFKPTFAKLRFASDQVSIYATVGQVTACVDHALTVVGLEEDDLPQPDVSATVTISGRSVGAGLTLPPLLPGGATP